MRSDTASARRALRRPRFAASLASGLCVSVVCLAPIDGPPARAADRLRDDFATTPFAPEAPRWCERYHHAHFVDGGIRFEPSTTHPAECDAGVDAHAALSCVADGCGPCSADALSPCAKIGDRFGNAVLMTTRDRVGPRRSITVRFRIDRPLVAPRTHLGLYAALHPHCHSTVQAILVPDGNERFHLNLAVFNEFIGGDAERYAACRRNSYAEISAPLAHGIVLRTGEDHRWVLRSELDADGGVALETAVSDAHGRLLGAGRRRFPAARAKEWLGEPGAAARFAFGGQLGDAGGDADLASVTLIAVDARAAGGRHSGPGGQATPPDRAR